MTLSPTGVAFTPRDHRHYVRPRMAQPLAHKCVYARECDPCCRPHHHIAGTTDERVGVRLGPHAPNRRSPLDATKCRCCREDADRPRRNTGALSPHPSSLDISRGRSNGNAWSAAAATQFDRYEASPREAVNCNSRWCFPIGSVQRISTRSGSEHSGVMVPPTW